MDSNLFFQFVHYFIDVNECTLGLDNCDLDTQAICTNTIGSYTCACRTGYSGNGITCVGSCFC